ncbi:MAG: hypothetical protein QW434_09330 [Pyrobaculum sp.]
MEASIRGPHCIKRLGAYTAEKAPKINTANIADEDAKSVEKCSASASKALETP